MVIIAPIKLKINKDMKSRLLLHSVTTAIVKMKRSLIGYKAKKATLKSLMEKINERKSERNRQVDTPVTIFPYWAQASDMVT